MKIKVRYHLNRRRTGKVNASERSSSVRDNYPPMSKSLSKDEVQFVAFDDFDSSFEQNDDPVFEYDEEPDLPLLKGQSDLSSCSGDSLKASFQAWKIFARKQFLEHNSNSENPSFATGKENHKWIQKKWWDRRSEIRREKNSATTEPFVGAVDSISRLFNSLTVEVGMGSEQNVVRKDRIQRQNSGDWSTTPRTTASSSSSCTTVKMGSISKDKLEPQEEEAFASPDQGYDHMLPCCSSMSFFNSPFDDSVWSSYQRDKTISDDTKADTRSRCTSTQTSLFPTDLFSYQHERGFAPSDEEENK